MSPQKNIKKQPSAYSGIFFHVVRAVQLASGTLVTTVMAYFIHHVRQGSWAIPFFYILLFSAAVLTIISMIVTGTLLCLRRLKPIYNASINGVLAILWTVGCIVLAVRTFESLQWACTSKQWGDNQGVRVCQLYKALSAGSLSGMVSSLVAFGLDIATLRQQSSRGKYVRALNPDQDDDTTYLRAAASKEDVPYDDSERIPRIFARPPSPSDITEPLQTARGESRSRSRSRSPLRPL